MTDSPTTPKPKKSQLGSSTARFTKERDAIRCEIDASIRKISDLKTYLNTLTLIGQLPNEVLAEILVAYARDHFYSTTPGKPYMWRPPPEWIKLAHVCRHWRGVAFGTPGFWSYVRVRGPKTFSTLLPLSKSAPLYLDLALGKCQWVKSTEIIGQASHRLQEFRCVATPKQFKALAKKWAYCPMGFLKKLVLSRWEGEGAAAADDNGAFHLLTIPGSRQAPRLRHLELCKLPFLWTDPIFSSALTTLVVTVTASRDEAPFTGTFDQFMDALRTMAPTLVHLTLEECIPRLHSLASEPPRPTRWIPLPSLRSLHILCNTNDCVRFMGNLHIDPAAKLDVVVHGATGSQRLVQMISTHVSRSTPLLALKVFFPGHWKSKVTIAGYKDADLDSVDINDPAVSLTLSNAWPPCRQVQERPLTVVLRAAEKLFLRVQTLRMSSFLVDDYDDDLPALFQRMPSVETLDIGGHPGTGFFKLILSDARPQTDADTQPEGVAASALPLARLRELRLGCARFRNSSRDNPWRGSKRVESDLVDELLEWAVLRRGCGHPLEMLRLWQCTRVTEKDVSRLEEVVTRVEWDWNGVEDGGGEAGIPRQIFRTP